MSSAAENALPSLSTGTVIGGRYRIQRVIGSGGMGTVYEAEHSHSGQLVAIKVLRKIYAEEPDIVERFRREAHAAAAIGHPNIIQVFELGEMPSGAPFMALELLSGRDFARDIAAMGAQSLGKAAHVLKQVCDALGAAHAKGIVHRDLKPENVFLIERDGDPNFVKLLDFGVSKFQDKAIAPGIDLSLTNTGALLGTPRYMSPEQCKGRRDLDHRTDIFSLGVILFRALSGRYPFDADSYPMIVMQITTRPTPNLARVCPDLPREIVDLVTRMLAKKPDVRPQSCQEIADVLARFATREAEPPRRLSVDEVSSPVESLVRSIEYDSEEPDTDAFEEPSEEASDYPASDYPATVRLEESHRESSHVQATSRAAWPAEPIAQEPAPRRFAWAIALIAGLGVFVSVIGGTFTWLALTAPSPPARVSAARAASLPVRDVIREVRPAEPATVAVRIEASPAHAEILLDQQRVANPFEGQLPRGGMRHLVIRADGYVPHERNLSLATAQEIAVSLAPVAPVAEPVRTRHGRRARTQVRAQQLAPAPAPAPAPVAVPRRQSAPGVESVDRFHL